MSKICLIRQPAGLGDILFGQKIAKHYTDKGYRVIWPVIPEFKWIGEYIGDVEFPSTEDNFPYKEKFIDNNKIKTDSFIYLPLQVADRYFPGISVMDAKYKFVGLDYSDWRDYLTINRNSDKEDDLFYNVLGLSDDTEYVFVNRNFGSPPKFIVSNKVEMNHDVKIIELSFIEGYTLFDWYKVLENASEIHTVETSLNFLIEVDNNITCKKVMYSKHNPPHFRQVKHLFMGRWDYILN